MGTGARRELLDHIIAVNERHLRRLLFDYVRYRREDRTHLGLGKGLRRGGFVPQTPGALLRTIDSVDCIIDSARRNVLESEAKAELDLTRSAQ